MAALLVSFGISSHAQEVSSPEARAWLQKTFPQQSSEGHYLISSNVLEKSGNWYCGEDNEKFSCRTITVFPSMSFSVSKKGEFDVSLMPPTSALKYAENINDISLNFSNGDTVYIRHTWNFDREGDDIRAFIHALTSSKNVNLTFNGDMQRWTLPLSGTSRAVDSMAFWAAEHRASLPFPFYQAETAEAGENGAVSFHTARPAVSREEHHGKNNIGFAQADEKEKFISGEWNFSYLANINPQIELKEGDHNAIGMTASALFDGEKFVRKPSIFITTNIDENKVGCFRHDMKMILSDGEVFTLEGGGSCLTVSEEEPNLKGISNNTTHVDEERLGQAVLKGALPTRIIDGGRQIILIYPQKSQSISRFRDDIDPQKKAKLYDIMNAK